MKKIITLFATIFVVGCWGGNSGCPDCSCDAADCCDSGVCSMDACACACKE